MSEHVVDSPKHGALPVIVDEHPDEYGRTWRARLWPAPPRLAHLVAVAVGLYDAHGIVLRHRAVGR